MKSLIQQFSDKIYPYHISMGRYYQKEDIEFISKLNGHLFDTYSFSMTDYFRGITNTINISMKEANIIAYNCTCEDFKSFHSCEHVAAVIINYEYLMSFNTEDYLKNKSSQIIDIFSKRKSGVKKKLKVEYEINGDVVDYGHSHNSLKSGLLYLTDITLKIKIGIDKMYLLNNKFSRFVLSYENGGEVPFGKSFIYDASKYYFDDTDKKILDYLINKNPFKLFIDYNDLNIILDMLKEKDFFYKNILIRGISDISPFSVKLSKKEDKYVFAFNIDYDDMVILTSNLKYIYTNGKIYKLSKDYRNLFEALNKSRISELVFEESNLDNFCKGILPIVRNDLVIDEELNNKINLSKADAKLYFDLNKNDVVCNVKLEYGNVSFDYFEEEKSVLRDVDFENEILEHLYSYGFKIEKNKFIIDNVELIVNLINIGLEELSNLYSVYTSTSFKSVKIKNNVKVSSTFSIGKDNIMHYEFDLDDITDKEFDELISAFRKKKKYYRLKNGDIVNLEQDSINELNDLMENLDFDKSGSIGKYQAIYLDSLKSNRKLGIKTDNLFDEFINNFNKYKDATINFNKKDKEILRGYQIDGIKWLYTICKCDLGGILADEMGLGKSIQTIYLIKELLKEDKNSKFLIVCPTALVFNWVNEFNKFGSEINVKVLVGAKDSRKKILKDSSVEVFITSYGVLREDIEMYEGSQFRVCFIDEAQNIKNPNAGITKSVKQINALTKFALTGTPIENSISELWSIFDFIMPGFLSNLSKFNSRYRFGEIDEEADKKLTNLNQMIRPFIMRRLKNDVLKDLPPKMENNIYIDLGENEKKLYASEIKRVQKEMEEMLEYSDFNKSRFQILSLLTRLRELCIDPKLVYENYKGESLKIENLVKVVKEIILNGHKILIFSSFKSAFQIVREKLKENDISYYTIDGSVSGKKRQELVDKFNSDNTNVFLITLKSGGTGLNLTSADVVIHLDLWWNPQAENQATDRTHRIGQTKTVQIIKLIARGTIEERILDLQKKKKLLSDKLIENSDGNIADLSNLTEKDIRDLLKYENE